jgi:hypothetical protein
VTGQTAIFDTFLGVLFGSFSVVVRKKGGFCEQHPNKDGRIAKKGINLKRIFLDLGNDIPTG